MKWKILVCLWGKLEPIWNFELDSEEFLYMGYMLIQDHWGGEAYANVGHFTKNDILITYAKIVEPMTEDCCERRPCDGDLLHQNDCPVYLAIKADSGNKPVKAL